MTSLNPLHTLEKQLAESIELHQGLRGEAVRERIIELLTKVGIRDPESRLGAYPHQLSGGQRQRVMIAMALANGPELLIADEPTTALDVTIQAQILDLLAELKRDEGMSLLFITHDLTIVRKIADRVCVMKDGEIVEQGPTAEIFADPQHPYTRRCCWRPNRPACPAPVPDAAPDGGQHRPPADLVPDPSRAAAADGGPYQGGQRGHADRARGRDPRHRRRKRLGQDHAGAGDHAADRIEGRIAFRRAARSQDLNQRADAAPAARHADRVSGPVRLAVAAHDRRPRSSPRGWACTVSIRGRDRREMVAEIMVEVGLDPATMDRYPHEFSGGQRQRIAIARAMILRPQAAGAGRADQRARHDRPGADRASCCASCSESTGWPICSSAMT